MIKSEAEFWDIYYRARYYDPNTGRFLSEDPISFLGGDTNLYRYVLNNPVLYTDPKGTLSPASVTACAVMFAAGELYDIYSNFDDQFKLQQDTQNKLDALDQEAKTCSSNRKVKIMLEKDKIMKDFQMKSGGNILGAFTPGAGAGFATAGCLAALWMF